MITLDIGLAPTATKIYLACSAYGGTGTFEIQISTTPDFRFCVAPIYTGIARGAAVDLEHVNQRSTYYIRGRTRLADGSIFNGNWGNVLAIRTADGGAQATAPAAIMTMPAIIFRPEPVTSIAVTAGTAVDGFPLANLLRDAPVAAKLSGAAQPSFQVRTGGQPVDTFALLNTNLPEAGTISIRGRNTPAGAFGYELNAQPFRASANLPGRDGFHSLTVLPAPQSYLYWDIRVIGPVPFNQFTMEHFVFGLNRKTKNMSVEKSETPLNLGSKERTRTGNPDAVKGRKMRRVEFELAYLTEAQSETMFYDINGWLDEPVFVVPNSKAGGFLHDRILYGDLKGGRAVQASSLHHTRNFTVESVV